MDWEIIWTEPALDGLEAAVRYTARQSPVAAEKLRSQLLESVGLLARLPEIGPVFERDHSERTREIVCGPYRIF